MLYQSWESSPRLCRHPLSALPYYLHGAWFLTFNQTQRQRQPAMLLLILALSLLSGYVAVHSQTLNAGVPPWSCVMSRSGPVRLQRLDVGDPVLAYDLVNNRAVFATITEYIVLGAERVHTVADAFHNDSETEVELLMEDSLTQVRSALSLNSQQAILVAGAGWVIASALQLGDALLSDHGSLSYVSAIVVISRAIRYSLTNPLHRHWASLEVTPHHSFFVYPQPLSESSEPGGATSSSVCSIRNTSVLVHNYYWDHRKFGQQLASPFHRNGARDLSQLALDVHNEWINGGGEQGVVAALMKANHELLLVGNVGMGWNAEDGQAALDAVIRRRGAGAYPNLPLQGVTEGAARANMAPHTPDRAGQDAERGILLAAGLNNRGHNWLGVSKEPCTVYSRRLPSATYCTPVLQAASGGDYWIPSFSPTGTHFENLHVYYQGASGP